MNDSRASFDNPGLGSKKYISLSFTQYTLFSSLSKNLAGEAYTDTYHTHHPLFFVFGVVPFISIPKKTTCVEVSVT